MNKVIVEGENILLFLDRRRNYLVKVESGKELHTHKGFVTLDHLVGKEFGSRIKSNMDVSFVALRPSIRDYVFKMSRRTQIIYPKDIAFIVFFGNIQPGSLVVEAGTGTGALTAALAHYVRPSGRVYSYELRKEFIADAVRNLEKVGISEYVEIMNKDATEGIEEREIDTVVLDLATPWLVVPHAHEALKGSGILVSFSPTINQIVKTTEVLREKGFVGIETVECLLRRMQTEKDRIRPETLMTGHTGYMVFARKTLEY